MPPLTVCQHELAAAGTNGAVGALGAEPAADVEREVRVNAAVHSGRGDVRVHIAGEGNRDAAVHGLKLQPVGPVRTAHRHVDAAVDCGGTRDAGRVHADRAVHRVALHVRCNARRLDAAVHGTRDEIDALFGALGLDAAVAVARNRFDYLVEVAGAPLVLSLEPDMARLAEVETRGVIVTARAADDGHDFVSRWFGPRVGVAEDPVTGSAHCCLGPWWAERLGRTELRGFQASERGGTVGVRVLGDRVELAGDAVTVLRGELVSQAGGRMEKVRKSEADWKRELSPEQYRILRQKGTERPFTGEYNAEKRPGVYRCAACGEPLFSSDTKYDSGSGWPSFYAPIDSEHVATEEDGSLGMRRVEVMCARCESHLGHVFPDGPAPTGERFCVNSASLKLDPKE